MVRKLSDEEHRLWAGVVRSVRPLHPARASVTPLPADTGAPATPEARQPPRAKPRRAAPVVPEPPKPQAPPLAPIGRRDTRRLVRGTTDIDARIDLHGMTQSEAHAALRGFLVRAQGAGARYVLVITGKGGDGDGLGRGILRRQVPQWLQLPEFRACVTGFDAAVGHGGAGALYVRIRRPR
ncbi:Smr/MutS family protein [Rhodoplanes sp. TEM]|uniref:Smr/MutS family protein n=1 Tax=Rhodoplanes tepidamans TaxID=200616 RepID=A0ABT5J3V1_RHOTP|nr:MULTISPECIES: Smr/MutS family protein [Rhodoplanes]MDC7784233.1 Smr/MutS family protein [Rhodoplanes tepidamans]MDC7983625.1 Smr/MutS family protein [Rhodoplanes sp. TEM]MDQ0353632.1 DNA-nicking Smr family endonuclease [Rhodoplanes tepidamans]